MPDSSTLATQRYRALLELLRTAECVWSASRVFFAQWDLSPSQFNTLNLLHQTEAGLTQSDLSRELITHRSNVTGLVDRLEQRGLVARKANRQDRRAWHVVLTRQGESLLLEILPGYYKVAEEVWGITPVSRTEEILEDLRELATRAGGLAARIGTKPA
jgi:DNA-binding MarR family transcriptional regulator